MDLRPYQVDAVAAMRREVIAGRRRIILQAPTGSGKTICAAELIRGAVAKEKRVVFLAPRRELINQCSEKLATLGVRHGIIMAGVVPESSAVQVCCVPTLHARAMQRQKIELPAADLVICDETHLYLAPTYQAIVERYADAVVVGLTATPARGDGKALGLMFETIVPTCSVASLVEQGYLVPQRYYSPSKPDLAGVKIRAGDYAEDQLERAMDKPKLIGDIVANWQRLASDRQTVVFASGVQHSIHLRDEFRRVGVRAEHLDGKTPMEERKGIIARVKSGDVQVVCNCMVLTFGWDSPSVSCAVLARPTKSVVMYLQMAGRVLRRRRGSRTPCCSTTPGPCKRSVSWMTSTRGAWTATRGCKIGCSPYRRNRSPSSARSVTSRSSWPWRARSVDGSRRQERGGTSKLWTGTSAK